MMRVIDVQTFEFHECMLNDILGQYATLSHTWDTEEVTFTVFQDYAQRSSLKGWKKIQWCCEQAVAHGLKYAWVDTCCIDKSSSAELSEAINSMWKWYADANVCYVYLSDVQEQHSPEEQIRASRWFTRGWTLQELVAPWELGFYNQLWHPVGTRSSHGDLVAQVTGITSSDIKTLRLSRGDISIARKFAWAASRQTTRPEDLAYSLMGLTDVNMPLFYGEGSRKAFRRLQLE